MLLVDFVLTLVSEKQSSVADFSEVGVAFATTEPAVDSACFVSIPDSNRFALLNTGAGCDERSCYVIFG